MRGANQGKLSIKKKFRGQEPVSNSRNLKKKTLLELIQYLYLNQIANLILVGKVYSIKKSKAGFYLHLTSPMQERGGFHKPVK